MTGDLTSRIREAIEAVDKATAGALRIAGRTTNNGYERRLTIMGDGVGDLLAGNQLGAVSIKQASDNAAAIVAAINLLRDPAVRERLLGPDTQTTHAPGCWSWGPRHYGCAVAEVKRLRGALEFYVCECDPGECEAGSHEDVVCGYVAHTALE